MLWRLAFFGWSAAPASAQTVSDVLEFLVTGHSVETGSVERDAAAAAATSLTVSRALLANLATLPVGTSSGGFVYKFHPELGTVQRATTSFGPFFVERAAAPGHGAASIGLTLQVLAIHIARRPEPARRNARNDRQPVRR